MSPTRRKTVAALCCAVAAAGSLWLLLAGFAGGGGGQSLRRIDLAASVVRVSRDATWAITSGRTVGAASIEIDDGRTLTIPEGTYADAAPLVPACTTFDVPNSCVLLADMLGESVVWFALVQADPGNDTEFLTLPGVVDMRENGDEGVYSNGWVMALASPTKRNCQSQGTTNLRQFIELFGADRATSTLSLRLDTVVSVACLD